MEAGFTPLQCSYKKELIQLFRFKENIGILNALIRITIGLTMIGLSTAKLARKPWCLSSKLSIFLGAMKVAEGIVRFCPIVEAMKFGKYMNLPAMGMLTKANNKKQEANPFKEDDPFSIGSEKQHSAPHSSNGEKHETSSNNNGYDASDKQIETAIEAALGVK